MNPWDVWTAQDWVHHYASAAAASASGYGAGETIGERAQRALSAAEQDARQAWSTTEHFVEDMVHAPGKFVDEHEKSLKIAAMVALGVLGLVALRK